MNEKFTARLNQIKANQHLFSVDEANTKQASIEPILSLLGWDVFDTNEVKLEYRVESGKIDYSLRLQEQNKVFLEAKKASEDLERHQEQLLNYSFREGVRLAILTNGITWWFYLPLETGSWEQRKFFTVDLNEQALEDCIEKFESLLSRENIETGIAYQNAKFLYEGRQKNKIIRENLPKAWQKLISEPDEMLVELLNETLEKICGYKAEESQITGFLQNTFPNFSIGTLTSIGNSKVSNISNVQSEIPINQNIINLNPDEPEDLFYTKILEAKFADKKSPNNWRSVLDIGLQMAFEKGFSVENLQDKLNINFKEGIYDLQGFNPIKGANYSWQNQDANKTAVNAMKLTKLLNCEMYVHFEWREKGKFPMKQGLIHWKP